MCLSPPFTLQVKAFVQKKEDTWKGLQMAGRGGSQGQGWKERRLDWMEFR